MIVPATVEAQTSSLLAVGVEGNNNSTDNCKVELTDTMNHHLGGKEKTLLSPSFSCLRRSSATASTSSRNGGARCVVNHDYRDYYRHPTAVLEDSTLLCHDHNELVLLSSLSGSMKPQLRRGPRGGVIEPFPVKLHEMLSHVEKEGFADVVSWQPHGRCFVIRNPSKFVAEVMPKYFKQSKLTSFQRQVNLYGFRRLTKGKDRGGYYHERFLRGREDLCKTMIRQRVKGVGTRAASSPTTEPDFYSMEACLGGGEVMSSLNNDTIQAQEQSSDQTGTPLLSNNAENNADSSISKLGKEGGTVECGDSIRQIFPIAHRHHGNMPDSSLHQTGADKILTTTHPTSCSLLSMVAPCITRTLETAAVVSPGDSPVFSALPCPPRLPSPDFSLTMINGGQSSDSNGINNNTLAKVDHQEPPPSQPLLASFNNYKEGEDEVADTIFEADGLSLLDRLILEDLRGLEVM